MGVFMKMVIGMFLYFPEDKSEYIPAGITFGIVLLLATLAMFFIVKHSKKEEAKYKKMEVEIMKKERNQKVE